MEQKTGSVWSMISDLLFWLIMFVCIAASVVVFTSGNRSGYQYKIFGVVQSGSMEASGLYKDDVIFVDRGKEYAIGDVVVFFRAPTKYGKLAKDVNLSSSPIWVHEIIDIRTDSLGRETYLTKGTSNKSDDGFYVPEDFVMGKAKKMPDAVGEIIKFLFTPIGVILIICVPSSLLFFFFTREFILALIEQAEAAKRAREMRTLVTKEEVEAEEQKIEAKTPVVQAGNTNGNMYRPYYIVYFPVVYCAKRGTFVMLKSECWSCKNCQHPTEAQLRQINGLTHKGK